MSARTERHPLLLAPLALALALLALPSCETAPIPGPLGRVSTTPDEWGNRPGPRGFTTVILDAGHGGVDSGARARSNGLLEKNLALDMAQRVRRQLSGSFKVVLTRDSDRFVDLDDRVRFANRYSSAVLVSLHFNDSRVSACTGPETYWWRVDSYTLARRVQSSISQVADQNHSRGLVRRRLRLTRNPAIPCILVECGYLSNAREARDIASPAYRDKLARAIASAIRQQAAEGDGNLGPLPPFIKAPPSRHTDARGS